MCEAATCESELIARAAGAVSESDISRGARAVLNCLTQLLRALQPEPRCPRAMSALTEAEKVTGRLSQTRHRMTFPSSLSASHSQRERQQKALGAAFLAHQVSQLEKSVDSLSLDRSRQLYDPNGTGAARSRGGPAPSTSTARSSRGAGRDTPGSQRIKPVRVLDASVLVHGLPLVKLWVREDSSKLIVPLAGERASARLNETERAS